MFFAFDHADVLLVAYFFRLPYEAGEDADKLVHGSKDLAHHIWLNLVRLVILAESRAVFDKVEIFIVTHCFLSFQKR